MGAGKRREEEETEKEEGEMAEERAIKHFLHMQRCIWQKIRHCLPLKDDEEEKGKEGTRRRVITKCFPWYTKFFANKTTTKSPHSTCK